MMFSLYAAALILSFGLWGCAKKPSAASSSNPVAVDESWPIFGKNAKGTINGYAWNFRSGRAFIIRKHNQEYLQIELWNELTSTPCGEQSGSTLQTRLMAPLEAAHWVMAPDDPFNANLYILFSDASDRSRPRDSMRADEGRIAFYQISEDSVYGYVQASFEAPDIGSTQVEGDYRIPICPTPGAGFE